MTKFCPDAEYEYFEQRQLPARPVQPGLQPLLQVRIYIYGYIYICGYTYIWIYPSHIWYVYILWWCCDVMSSRIFNLFWKFVQPSHGWWCCGVAFFRQQWLRFWPKSALCVKSNLCHVHCITASLRCAELGIWIVVFLSRNFQGFCSCTTKPDYLQWILCLSRLILRFANIWPSWNAFLNC